MKPATNNSNRLRTGVLLGLLCMLPMPTRLLGEGHGPAFGLATPTLAEGGWSSDSVVMSLGTSQGTVTMVRETFGYGITQDLQANLSFPVSPAINRLPLPPRTRFGTMMGAFGDVEGSLMWRFQRRAPAVGTRFESTLLLGGSFPTDSRRAGVLVAPSVNVAAVTGYASRTFYWWLGGGLQSYLSRGADRLGALPYVTAVLGYRPPVFQRDYPKPDWRIFLESVGEFPRRDKIDGVDSPNSGGEKLLLGPSTLGLYGKWGVEAGVLFPVLQHLNGRQPPERFRIKFTLTYWL